MLKPWFFWPGETLGRGDGSWDDVDYQFVECRESPAPLEYYYRDLSEVYGGPDGTEGRDPYHQAKLDIMFLNSAGTHYPCLPIQARVRSMYPDSRKDDAVRAAFHFDEGYSWRWPKPHERIYHRPAGGYVGISLEHLRGMRPTLH